MEEERVEPGTGVHTFEPSVWEAEAGEFETSLVYVVNSKMDRDGYVERPPSKKAKQTGV